MKVRITKPCRFEPFLIANEVGSVVDLPAPVAVELIEIDHAEEVKKSRAQKTPAASPKAERAVKEPKSEKATKK